MFLKIKNYITENTGILIRLDDIAENMNWDLMEKSELLFEKYQIKPILGVIPNNQDNDLLTYPKRDNFWEQVRKWKKKGWEIGMHGTNHSYDNICKKVDYLGVGGNTEFCNHELEHQVKKIEIGISRFKEEKINVRTFFAPNHTFDENTLKALNQCGINEVIDGYGLMPYTENQIKFVPQLFYKVFALPFGIQTTQIHLNYWKQKEFDDFERFVDNNYKKIITYNQALKKINDNIFYTLINLFTKKIVQTKRLLKK